VGLDLGHHGGATLGVALLLAVLIALMAAGTAHASSCGGNRSGDGRCGSGLAVTAFGAG